MKLKLHNILKVADADIELGGLTVITGENDSGKSTVGKVLFSTLKAANNVRQVDRVNTLSIPRTQLASVKRLFSRYGHDLPSLENRYKSFRRAFETYSDALRVHLENACSR